MTHVLGRTPTGATALKWRQLQAVGWALLPVPYWEWDTLGSISKGAKQEYLRAAFQGTSAARNLLPGTVTGTAGVQPRRPCIILERLRLRCCCPQPHRLPHARAPARTSMHGRGRLQYRRKPKRTMRTTGHPSLVDVDTRVRFPKVYMH